MLRKPPLAGPFTISGAGPTDRTQLPNLEATSVTIQAHKNNVGDIYIGDFEVTNSAGNKEGISLSPGGVLSSLSIENLSHIFLATDNDGDKIKLLLV